MKKLLLCFCSVSLFSVFSMAQSQDVWIRFNDTTNQTSGFKDVKGNIKIPATLYNVWVDSFFQIIAARELVNDSYRSFYLLKNGKRVAYDSVYFLESYFDVESEGKIRFQDSKKDRAGYLNKDGLAIIPAMYNYAHPFRNGVAVVGLDAKRKCWDGDSVLNCEHYGWEGGRNILINESNEVLVDSFTLDPYGIDWNSMRINDPNPDTNTHVLIEGRHGNVYSFLDQQKEMEYWYNSIFLPAVQTNNPEAVLDLCFPWIEYWDTSIGWATMNKSTLFEKLPFSALQKRLQPDTLKRFFFSDNTWRGGVYSIQEEQNIDKNINDIQIINPVFDLVVSYYMPRKEPLEIPAEYADKKEWQPSSFYKAYELDFQERVYFVKTNKGYRLVGVSLPKLRKHY